MNSKRDGLRALDQAQTHLQHAHDLLGFQSYPGSIGIRVALGLDTRETVRGNHGRDSIDSFPTDTGKQFDELRERIRQVYWDLGTFYETYFR